MIDKGGNIVLETLKSKLQDLDIQEQRLDDLYSRDKRAIAEQKRQINKALELVNENESTIASKPTEKRGRKGEDFDPYNYPYEGSFKNKVLFAIHDSRRFLHVKEIADYIIKKEPATSPIGLNNIIGRTIWKINNSGGNGRKLASVKEGASLRNIFYGFTDWLENSGRIKKGREYLKASVTDRIGITVEDMFAGIPDKE